MENKRYHDWLGLQTSRIPKTAWPQAGDSQWSTGMRRFRLCSNGRYCMQYNIHLITSTHDNLHSIFKFPAFSGRRCRRSPWLSRSAKHNKRASTLRVGTGVWTLFIVWNRSLWVDCLPLLVGHVSAGQGQQSPGLRQRLHRLGVKDYR